MIVYEYILSVHSYVLFVCPWINCLLLDLGYLWVNEGMLTVRMGSRKKYDQISSKEDFAGILWAQFIWNWTQGQSLETCDHIAYENEYKVKVIFQIIWGENRVLLILKSRLNPCTDGVLPFYLCSSKQPKEQVVVFFFFFPLKMKFRNYSF